MAEDGKKKKIAVIGLSSIVLVAMVVAVTVGVNRGGNGGSSDAATGSDDAEISTSTKSIQSLCQPTDYKETCEKSLTAAAGNTTDPKELVKVAFTVAVDEIKAAINNSTTLKEILKDPQSAKSVQNCKQLLEYSIDDIKKSFDKIGEFDLTKVDDMLDELNTWLSGSLTFQTTCIDQFENRTDDAGEKMTNILKTARELTVNGLNMVMGISSILTNLQIPGLSRRLLFEQQQSETPSWVNEDHERLLQETVGAIQADLVVAKDGSGKYKTIGAAVKDIPLLSQKRIIVHVKAGVYDEIVTIPKDMNNVMFVGDGPTHTKVTGSLSRADGVDTWMSATFAVIGDNFIARDMAFENTAGSIKRQAVALRIQSHRAIVYNCLIDGNQSTLYAHVHQQFYRDCTITGTLDFIFGNAKAIFQNCKIIVKQPGTDDDRTQCAIVASGRELKDQATAMVLQNCTISASPEFLKNQAEYSLEAYLGRPWKPFARAIVMQSQIDGFINPFGWIAWTGNSFTTDSFLTEYANRGPGAALTKRATWPGVKKTTSETQVVGFTVGKFIHGDSWIAAAHIPYEPGMIAGL